MRAGYVAEQLGVSVQTVRSWSNEFSEFLSPGAARAMTADGGQSQRRYVDADLALFERVKAQLADGATFEEARRQLREMTPEERVAPPVAPTRPTAAPAQGEASAALVAGDLFRALSEAHRGEVDALRLALAEARARADLLQQRAGQLQQELDELRATAARLALPAPEAPPPSPSIPTEPPTEPSQSPPPAPIPWWKRLFGK